jgi:hypothetical protein
MALVLVLNVALVVGLLALLAATMILPLRLRSEPRELQAPRTHWASRRRRAEQRGPAQRSRTSRARLLALVAP